MKRANLIPASRLDGKRRRNVARRCAVACALYTVLVFAAALLCRVGWSDDLKSAQERLDSADAIVEHTTRSLAMARGELTTAKTTLAVNRQLASQPDWSLLLKLFASQTGDFVVLKSVAINAGADPSAPAVSPVVAVLSTSGRPVHPAPPPRTVRVLITGAGDSPLAVTQFVVRLESAGLFGRVTVLETSRDTVLAEKATAFRLECILNGGEK